MSERTLSVLDGSIFVVGDRLGDISVEEGRAGLARVFAGFPAPLTTAPVAFPTASRPQARAAGAPLLVLSTILGLQPGFTDAKANLPGQTGEVSLRRRPGASEAASLPDRSAV